MRENRGPRECSWEVLDPGLELTSPLVLETAFPWMMARGPCDCTEKNLLPNWDPADIRVEREVILGEVEARQIKETPFILLIITIIINLSD